MSISKKLLSVIMTVIMAASMLVAIPATASAATDSVRINETTAKVGYKVLYDFYVQTKSDVTALEGVLNYDTSVLKLTKLTYDCDSNMASSKTENGDWTTYTFAGSKSSYSTSSSRMTVLTAVFEVVGTGNGKYSTSNADAVSAAFTTLESYSDDLLKGDDAANTNITTRAIVAATKVTMAKSSVTLNGKNSKATVKVKSVGPVNSDVYSSYACTFKSSNTKVAKVSGRATSVTITAVGAGTCYIDCIPDGALTKTRIKVTVKQPVTKVSVSKSKLTLKKKNSSANVTVKVAPSNASNKNVSVTNSNKKVVKVNRTTVKSGAKVKITALKKGKATITFKAKDGSNKSAKCVVTVKK
jgi:hypothetical protein